MRAAVLLFAALIASSAAADEAGNPFNNEANNILIDFALAEVTAIRAADICPGVTLDVARLEKAYGGFAGDGDDAKDSLAFYLRLAERDIDAKIAAKGREAWCKATFEAVGPAGTIVPGLLRR